METKPCENCGVVFERPFARTAADWERRRFCSRPCSAAGRRGIVYVGHEPEGRNCAACGKTFVTGGRGRAKRDAEFCSRLCAANARWRTGSTANDLTIPQAAYMAGLIDGEGSIMIYRRGKGAAMRVTVANTSRVLLDWCSETCGVGNIVTTKPKREQHKPGGMWLVNSQAAASLLQQIRPYLVIKAKQADLALDFQRKLKIPAEKAEKEWQEQWRRRMRGMNARGPRPA